jgi:hypothetical protein
MEEESQRECEKVFPGQGVDGANGERSKVLYRDPVFWYAHAKS